MMAEHRRNGSDWNEAQEGLEGQGLDSDVRWLSLRAGGLEIRGARAGVPDDGSHDRSGLPPARPDLWQPDRRRVADPGRLVLRDLARRRGRARLLSLHHIR